MAERNRPHIILTQPAEAEPYTSHQSGRGSRRPPPPIDRHGHGTGLARAIENVQHQGRSERRAVVEQTNLEPLGEGVRVVFDSVPGFDLKLATFDPQTQGPHPELLSVTEVVTSDGTTVERATVFVPEGQLSHFVQRFEQYATEETKTGKPKHSDFVERISAVRLATIAALWTDATGDFPPPEIPIWWELWLRHSDGEELDRLSAVASQLEIELGDRHLIFDNRTIVLARATAQQLSVAGVLLDDFAELRRARITAEFFRRMPAAEQAEWTAELAERTRAAGPGAPVVCILDTGVAREHPLLVVALDADDVHACDPGWGTHDHHGHGTEMAGLSLYGDLVPVFADVGELRLRHRLESVKVLPPPPGANRPELYGAITAEAVSRVEVQDTTRRRAFSLPISTSHDSGGYPGTPTSWSAAIDALAAGREFDSVNGELKYIDEASVDAHRLFIVAAGNINGFSAGDDHLDRSDVEPVEDPGQAWNALTVGAYTDLVDVAAAGPAFDDWAPVAAPGELSPFSRTSVAFQRQWPNKPDVVLEGGNTAVSPGGDVDWPESLQLLTTSRDIPKRLLTTSNATSAATAQGARLAGIVAAEYPNLWPETVRALLVHAAEWTSAMHSQFSAAGDKKTARGRLLRRYGFGVPDLSRALRSATDDLTLVVQDAIHPFHNTKLREMHVHDLPWPVDVLQDLGETSVQLRVTLSYFIEPNPARRGWRRRYSYASHGLRFELKQPSETNHEFRKRLNKRALDEEEDRPTVEDIGGWFLGPTARNHGSLHGDIWEGTAADLAARGRVAVFPVTGWWKDQAKRDRSDLGVRYALVISIRTPAEAADVWTPVAQKVGVPIEIATEWS